MRAELLRGMLGISVAALSLGAGCGSGSNGNSPSSSGSGGNNSGTSTTTGGSTAGPEGTTGTDTSTTAAQTTGTTSSGSASVCHLVGEEMRLTNAAGSSRAPSVIWNGNAFVVAFADDRTGSGDIYVAQVSAAGAKVADEVAVVSTPTPSSTPTLALSGQGLLLTWTEQAASGLAVMAEPLAADGSGPGGAMQVAVSSATEARPTVTSAFGAFASTWMTQSGSVSSCQVAKVDATGQASAPAAMGVPTAAAQYPYPAASDSNLAVVYCDSRDGHINVRASLFDAQLAPGQDVVVRDATGDTSNPSVTWDGNQFVAAWEDLRSGDEQIFVARVHPDGTVDVPFMIHDADQGSANWPKLASNGTDTAVTYYQYRTGAPQIFLSVLGADGARKGGDLQVSNAPTGKARFASIAYGNGQYGVAWEDTRFGDPEIFFALVACQ